MIEVNFTLENEDGGPSEQVTRDLPQVPALGEMIALHIEGLGRSYKVIDVLWNVWRDGPTSATVHARELNWHKHYGARSD